jgi:hypothetical protein
LGTCNKSCPLYQARTSQSEGFVSTIATAFKIVAGLEKALAVHNDPDIPDGTSVQSETGPVWREHWLGRCNQTSGSVL